MPPTKTQSKLMAKYGNKIAVAAAKHANDEIDWGFQRLPGGIANGIAKLKECGFGVVAAGKTNAGEYFFRAMGVVVSPKEFEGAQTSILEMVCDTKNGKGEVTTTEVHVARIQNEMKKLAGPDLDVSDLEAAAELLAAAGPYFKFSTSLGTATQQYPTPRVFENWHGTKGLEDYVPDTDAGVVDNTAKAPTSNGKPATKPPAKAAAKAPEPEPEPEGEFLGDMSVESLLEMAGGDGEHAEPAQQRLKELAIAAGHSEEDVDAAEDWDAVASMVDNPPAEEEEVAEEVAEEVEEEWSPAKGETYKFKPVDPKTKKRGKAIEVQITAVDAKTQTVTMVDSDTKRKTFKGVKWTDLESAD